LALCGTFTSLLGANHCALQEELALRHREECIG